MNGLRKEKPAPVPLATLDMQKRVTRELRMPGEAIMKIAEELYQGGFISYPRTETDGFSKDYDLMVRGALNEAHQYPVSKVPSTTRCWVSGEYTCEVLRPERLAAPDLCCSVC